MIKSSSRGKPRPRVLSESLPSPALSPKWGRLSCLVLLLGALLGRTPVALAMFGYGPAMGMGGYGMGGYGMGGYGMSSYGGIGGMGNYGLAGMPGYSPYGTGVAAAVYPNNYTPVVSVPQTVTNLQNGPLSTGSATPLNQYNYSPNGYGNYTQTVSNGSGNSAQTGQANRVPLDSINNENTAPARHLNVYGGTSEGATSAR